jgi:hypothetical protein
MRTYSIGRIVQRVTALAAGGFLLQGSSCAMDEAMMSQLLNMVVQAYLGGMTSGF